MHYTMVVFNADFCGEFKYGFKVNMVYGELEVRYDNFLGGYTTKGIELNSKQHNHLKQLLQINNFEKFRGNLNINDENFICLLDPYSWNLQCISDGGKPILEINSEMEKILFPPKSLIKLVEYVAKIGIETEIFERMRLF